MSGDFGYRTISSGPWFAPWRKRYALATTYRIIIPTDIDAAAPLRGVTHRSDTVTLEPVHMDCWAGSPTYHALGRDVSLLTITEGYSSDGPSGPTWDSRSAMRAVFVRDALYELGRKCAIPRRARYAADLIFHRLLMEDGMMPIRAWAWFRGVRWFAFQAFR